MDMKEFGKLIEKIKTGDAKDKDKAARKICADRDITNVEAITELLNDDDPAVRSIGSVILSVFGVQYTKKHILDLQDDDAVHSVRIAGMLGVKYFGKLPYDRLMDEIRNYTKDMLDKKKEEYSKQTAEQPKKAVEQERKPIKKLKQDEKRKKKSRKKKKEKFPWKIAVIGAGAVIVIAAVVLLFTSSEKENVTGPPPEKELSIAERLAIRNQKTVDFQSVNLSPDSPDANRSYTETIETMFGDTYESVAQRMYTVPLFEESGMNTILASWRKVNFPYGSMQKEADVLKRETSKETLIFPNLAGLHLKYNLDKGTVAHESLINKNKDVKIYIVVDKVTLK